jgi:hypothetical protein
LYGASTFSLRAISPDRENLVKKSGALVGTVMRFLERDARRRLHRPPGSVRNTIPSGRNSKKQSQRFWLKPTSLFQRQLKNYHVSGRFHLNTFSQQVTVQCIV